MVFLKLTQCFIDLERPRKLDCRRQGPVDQLIYMLKNTIFRYVSFIKVKQNPNQREQAQNSMRYTASTGGSYNTCMFSVRSISFSSTAFGPICRWENASVEGAIWFKLNFWLELEEQRANRTEAPIDRFCDDNSQAIVFHNLLAYSLRPARKALRYMVKLRSWEKWTDRKIQIDCFSVNNFCQSWLQSITNEALATHAFLPLWVLATNKESAELQIWTWPPQHEFIMHSKQRRGEKYTQTLTKNAHKEPVLVLITQPKFCPYFAINTGKETREESISGKTQGCARVLS